MRGQLRQIERRLQRGRQQIGREKLAHLPQALRQYAATGRVPDEPAASFVGLLESFDRMINASVGGSDYGAAREAYEAAVKRWERTERDIEWTA